MYKREPKKTRRNERERENYSISLFSSFLYQLVANAIEIHANVQFDR